ncbi:hypothetical protein CF319_g4919 [Tilletia indica]|nr:hypothetical protein CF319_g4919 [Tilletia indica]
MHPSAPASTPAGGGPAPSSSSSASVAAVPPPASAPFNPYELRFEDEHRPLPPSSRAQRAPLPPPFKLSSIPLEKRSELWNNPESADCIIIVPVPTREHEIPDVAFSPPTPAARETMKRKFEELRQAGAIPGLPSGPIPPPPGGPEPAGPAQIYQSVVGPQNAAAGPSSSSSGARNQEAPESLPALPRRDAQNFVAAPTPASSAAAASASASGSSSSEAPPQPIDPNRPVVYTEKMSAEEGRSFGLKLKAQLRLFELDKSSRDPRWPQDENGKKYAPEGWRAKHLDRHGFDSAIHSTVGHYVENAKEGSFKRRVFRAHMRVLGTQCGLLENLLTTMTHQEEGFRKGNRNTMLRPCTRSTSSFAKSSTAHQPRFAIHFTRPPGEETNENAEIERILFLPMPDPDSFPLLLHYLYHSQPEVFGASLERDNAGEIARFKVVTPPTPAEPGSSDASSSSSLTVPTTSSRKSRKKGRYVVPQDVLDRIPKELQMRCSWRGVIWNVEHLLLGKPLEKYLGAWYKHNIRKADGEGGKKRNRVEGATDDAGSSTSTSSSRKDKGRSTGTEKDRSASLVGVPGETDLMPNVRHSRAASMQEMSTMPSSSTTSPGTGMAVGRMSLSGVMEEGTARRGSQLAPPADERVRASTSSSVLEPGVGGPDEGETFPPPPSALRRLSTSASVQTGSYPPPPPPPAPPGPAPDSLMMSSRTLPVPAPVAGPSGTTAGGPARSRLGSPWEHERLQGRERDRARDWERERFEREREWEMREQERERRWDRERDYDREREREREEYLNRPYRPEWDRSRRDSQASYPLDRDERERGDVEMDVEAEMEMEMERRERAGEIGRGLRERGWERDRDRGFDQRRHSEWTWRDRDRELDREREWDGERGGGGWEYRSSIGHEPGWDYYRMGGGPRERYARAGPPLPPPPGGGSSDGPHSFLPPPVSVSVPGQHQQDSSLPPPFLHHPPPPPPPAHQHHHPRYEGSPHHHLQHGGPPGPSPGAGEGSGVGVGGGRRSMPVTRHPSVSSPGSEGLRPGPGPGPSPFSGGGGGSSIHHAPGPPPPPGGVGVGLGGGRGSLPGPVIRPLWPQPYEPGPTALGHGFVRGPGSGSGPRETGMGMGPSPGSGSGRGHSPGLPPPEWATRPGGPPSLPPPPMGQGPHPGHHRPISPGPEIGMGQHGSPPPRFYEGGGSGTEFYPRPPPGVGPGGGPGPYHGSNMPAHHRGSFSRSSRSPPSVPPPPPPPPAQAPFETTGSRHPPPPPWKPNRTFL